MAETMSHRRMLLASLLDSKILSAIEECMEGLGSGNSYVAGLVVYKIAPSSCLSHLNLSVHLKYQAFKHTLKYAFSCTLRCGIRRLRCW